MHARDHAKTRVIPGNHHAHHLPHRLWDITGCIKGIEHAAKAVIRGAKSSPVADVADDFAIVLSLYAWGNYKIIRHVRHAR